MLDNEKKFIVIGDTRIRIDDIESCKTGTEVLRFEKVYERKSGLFAGVTHELEWNGDRKLIGEKRYENLKKENYPQEPWNARWNDPTTYKQVFNANGDIVDDVNDFSYATIDDVIEEEYRYIHIVTSKKDYRFSEWVLKDEFEDALDEVYSVFG